MNKIVALILALGLATPARAYYSPYRLGHNTDHIVGGLISTGMAIWAFKAGNNSRTGAKEFCYTAGTLFALKAIYRFGGGH